ncbi:hypothetical protein F5X68DRAFT_240165 [Plectosphaerella plurivora]|uniref:F-box domain-containing protein n=1 Tax=Plectosphaerella plurivora TaxID=936078 RepID=A0A9P9AA23_9PEZI|nr:hypothetical protein F5X68DRAFT_240165 [Plectosphaerella plurivora]
MTKKKSVKARKAAHAAQANAARRPQQAPRLKIVADGLEIPARTAVLSTMELFEMILCHVDMSTVLFAQLVSTKWRDMIGASLPIQQHLFFAPVSRVPEARDEPPPPPTAPSLDDYAQPWVQRAMERAQRREAARAAQAHAVPTLAPSQNLLLKKHFGCMFVMLSSMSSGIQGWRRDRASENVNYLTTGKLMGMGMARGGQRIAGQGKPTAVLRAGASWRRMLVSQPPPRRLEHVRVGDGRASRNGWNLAAAEKQYRSVDLPDGITMGQLYDLVYAITFDRPTGRLSWVGWPDGRVVDSDLTLNQDPTPGSRLISMGGWAWERAPRGDSAILHNWKSTDCIVVGEEGVGEFTGFCRVHVDGPYDLLCQRCREGQSMQRVKARKRRLRNGVSGFASFFRCDEYTPGGTLIEEEKEEDLSDITTSDEEEEDEDFGGDESDDQDSLEDSADHDQAGDDSSDDDAWDAATDSDEELQ